MTIGKWPFAAITATTLLGLGLAGPEEELAARLTRPTMVVLDFHDRKVTEVTQEIARRSGKRIFESGPTPKSVAGIVNLAVPTDTSWRDRIVTLTSPKPVPFWEGIDRLAEAGRLAYHQGESNPGADSVILSFDGEGPAPSPANYAGPFRVGLLGVHEHNDLVFVRGPWARFYPSTWAVQGTADDLVAAPKDGGPLYVEVEVAVEPGLVCLRDGPLKALEAVDESGRSLLAPAREGVRQWFQAFAFLGGGIAPVVRIPLRRPEDGGRSRSIKTLRGLIPVEIAALQPKPALIIPLGDAEGKTFQGGGAVFTVETARTEPDGRMKLAFSCRLSGEEAEPFRRQARLALLRSYQLSLVDARGAVPSSSSGSSGGDGRGALTFSYEYVPSRQPDAPLYNPPAAIHYYDLDRAAWQIPFEFHDIPLPLDDRETPR